MASSASSGNTAPRQAEGAQIPMQDFLLPQFPREAGGLMALTLTSEIQASGYANVLREKQYKVTHLPPTIQSLTLESFALGYPNGFLRELIRELPELRSLVVYSQDFAAESREDALEFFKGAMKLRALHLLDVFFAQEGVVKDIAPVLRKLEKALMFLEINYTNRPREENFMERIPGGEFALLIGPGLISCSLNMAPPEDSTGPTDDGIAKDGIQTVDVKHNESLVKALLGKETAPRALKLLNTTLYSLSVDHLRRLVAQHWGMMSLSATIRVETFQDLKSSILDALIGSDTLEQVEIVLDPIIADDELCLQLKDLKNLSTKCRKLSNFKINILRKASKASVEWVKTGDVWKENRTEARVIEMKKPTKQENWSPWT